LSRRMLKLLLDENIGLGVYEVLKRRGYEVQTIIEELRGISDEEVLRIAVSHGILLKSSSNVRIVSIP